MTFQARVEAALQLLAATGMRCSNYAPPLYGLLWRAGIPIPPSPFAGAAVNLLIFGSLFGALYGAAMWFLVWQHQDTTAAAALIAAGFAGVLFGGAMAAYWVYKARKLKLPAWADIEPPASVFE